METSMPHQELNLLLKINSSIAAIRDKDELYRVIMEDLYPEIRFDDAVVIVLDPAQQNYTHLLTMSPPERQANPYYKQIVKRSLPFRDSLIEYFMRQPDLFSWNLAAMRERFPDYPGLELMRETGLQNSFNVKLRTGGREIGLLLFHYSGPGNFQPERQEFYLGIANQIAVAVGHIVASEQLVQSEREKTLQLEINNALLQTESLDELCVVLAQHLSRFARFDAFGLSIWQTEGELRYWNILTRSDGGSMNSMRAAMEGKEQRPNDDDQILDSALTKQAGIFKDAELTALCRRYPRLACCQPEFGFQSVIRLPFELKGERLARIFIAATDPQAFTADHLSRLENLMPQTALALGNLLTIEEIHRLKELLEQEKSYLNEEIKTQYNFEKIIGTSDAMQQVFDQIHQVAQTDSTVLITGETGTGKELITRAIHNISTRNDRPLIKVDCAALPETLIESELFGHEKGSFTGAHTRRIGKFELARGSTIFLDEVGELPLTMQTRLLRVLQEREVERVGGGRPIAVDVRIVAATNLSLSEAIAMNTFRPDLYYRLNVFPIQLPPLRHRKDDIPLLAEHFVRKYARKHHRRINAPSGEFISNLMEYEWPGNIRELEHVIERTIIAASGPDLKIDLSSKRRVYPDSQFEASTPLKTLKANESAHIIRALKRSNGKIRGEGGAAQILDIKPTTLESRMKKLGIRKSLVFEQSAAESMTFS